VGALTGRGALVASRSASLLQGVIVELFRRANSNAFSLIRLTHKNKFKYLLRELNLVLMFLGIHTEARKSSNFKYESFAFQKGHIHACKPAAINAKAKHHSINTGNHIADRGLMQRLCGYRKNITHWRRICR
jgi:hypothetical protein